LCHVGRDKNVFLFLFLTHDLFAYDYGWISVHRDRSWYFLKFLFQFKQFSIANIFILNNVNLQKQQVSILKIKLEFDSLIECKYKRIKIFFSFKQNSTLRNMYRNWAILDFLDR